MVEPYLPPEAPPNPPTPWEMIAPRRFWKQALWGSSLLAIIPPLTGIAFTAIDMTWAFNELNEAGGDAKQVSGHFAKALIGAAIGLFVGVVGLNLLVISVAGYRRAR